MEIMHYTNKQELILYINFVPLHNVSISHTDSDLANLQD